MASGVKAGTAVLRPEANSSEVLCNAVYRKLSIIIKIKALQVFYSFGSN